MQMGGYSTGGKPESTPSEILGSARSMGNATGTYSHDSFSTILEGQTVPRVRAAIEANQINPKKVPQAMEWLANKEAESHAK
jgi:hypothetical protein